MLFVGVASSAGLVGREVELGRLDRFVASLDGGAGAVLLGGGVGIGKTSVWRAAVERAEAAGVRVLRARCAEVEMPIAFGALADLLAVVLDEPIEGLSPRQRDALAMAFGGGAVEEGPIDWLLLAGAALAALRALAGRGLLLVAIDDLQWLDSGSRRVLAYALRRAADAPIGLLATVRDEGADEDPFALADALPPGRFGRVRLGPLSSGALGHLIASRLGVHLSRPTLGRVHRASGGNPMFGLEFARMLTERGRVGEAGAARGADVAGVARARARRRAQGLPGFVDTSFHLIVAC